MAFSLLFTSCVGNGPNEVPIAIGSAFKADTLAPKEEPDGTPHIVRVWLSEDTVAQGDVLRGHVTTTTNVASLEVRLGPRSANLKRQTFGQFGGRYRIPWLPLFLHRSYSIQIIARNAAGKATEVRVPIKYR